MIDRLKRSAVSAIGALAVATLWLSGCATLHRSEARSDEALLAAAGFEARPADTPAQRANLDAMTPRKLVAQAQGGRFLYVYADPDYCQCIYVGGPEAYSAYRRLAVETEMAEEEDVASMDPNLWRPLPW